MGQVIYVDFRPKMRSLAEETVYDFLNKIEATLCKDDLSEFWDVAMWRESYKNADPDIKTLVDHYYYLLDDDRNRSH